MFGFDEEQSRLTGPWVIATTIPPVRSQIHLQGMEFQSVRDAIRKRLAQSQVIEDGAGMLDPTMALADAWAVVADILGFYQWRITNEGYVGTALEPGSLFQLARQVDYAPDGGMSATCYVYYTIDESAPGKVHIPAGSKIRTIPQPGEEPLTFETREDLTARSSWNIIRPATMRDFDIDRDKKQIFLAGTVSGLKPNDLLRVVDRRHKNEHRSIYFVVRAVTFDRQVDQTIVDVAQRYPPADAFVLKGEKMSDAPESLLAKDPRTTSNYYQSQMGDRTWIEKNVLSRLQRVPTSGQQPEVEVFGYRKRVMVFGHNAPPQRSNFWGFGGGPWDLDTADLAPNVIDLEGHHPGILPGNKLCIEISDRSKLAGDLETYEIKAVSLVARTAYGITGDVTKLTLDRPWKSELWGETYEEVVQRVTVHVDDIALKLGLVPIAKIGPDSAQGEAPSSPVSGQTVELDGIYLGLEPGHRMILEGGPPPGSALANMQEPEILTLLSVTHPPYPEDQGSEEGDKTKGRTTVTFTSALKYQYDPSTVRIFGNVVEASHGETYEEVLGSGDGVREYQAFALARKPLAQLPSRAYPGVEAQISVRVGGEEWDQIPTLAAGSGRQRVFALWMNDASITRVHFGGEQFGARLPTGRENVVAKYRVGIGSVGNIQAGRLKLVFDHPLGVREASNTRANGGSDRESLSRLRANVPLSTLALDRLVSCGDYLSFARTYPGIAKAKAFHASTPAGDIVAVGILSDPTAPQKPGDSLCRALRCAMAERAEGSSTVFVMPGLVCPLFVSARVKISPNKSWEAAAVAIRAVLLQAFGFEARELGQYAYASEILAVIQSVPEVEFTTLSEFHRYRPEAERVVESAVQASDGRFDTSGNLTSAELLLFQPHMPGTIVLEPERT